MGKGRALFGAVGIRFWAGGCSRCGSRLLAVDRVAAPKFTAGVGTHDRLHPHAARRG